MYVVLCYLYVRTVGRVLNRFSKDLGFMDDVLPYHFYDFVFVSLTTFECT